MQKKTSWFKQDGAVRQPICKTEVGIDPGQLPGWMDQTTKR